MRIVCDASDEGLGAILLQENEKKDWERVKTSNKLRTKAITNELESISIVWAIEHFGNYIYAVTFEVVSGHKALENARKSKHGNKTYSRRLTRWIERLLPFDMEVVRQPGRPMGSADKLSRHQSDYNDSD